MGQKTLKSSLLAFIAITASANENNASNQDKFESQIRLGYQYAKALGWSGNEVALGGMLHYDSASWSGIRTGATLHTTQGYGKSTEAKYFVPFFDSNNDNYSILSELYLKGTWSNTEVVLGRQALETPFADSDDIGMIPNRFGAITVINKDIDYTTITFGHIRSWSGVDSDEPHAFTKMNGNDGVQVFGVAYEGIKDIILSGWYYHGNDLMDIGYAQASYENETDILAYTATLQYAIQDREDGKRANIWGISADIGLKENGLGMSLGYNQNNGDTADNFFGGGPFVTSMEHYTLAEAGDDGKIYMIGFSWDASSMFEGLVFGVNYADINRKTNFDANELDITAEYAFSEDISFMCAYGDINDDLEGDSQNLRVFTNYKF